MKQDGCIDTLTCSTTYLILDLNILSRFLRTGMQVTHVHAKGLFLVFRLKQCY